MTQDQLANHAGGNAHEQIVTAILHPLLTTGRLSQPMTAPVIDHIVVGTVLLRYAATFDPLVLRAGTHALGLAWGHTVRVLRLCMCAGARHGRRWRSGMLVLRAALRWARCRTVALGSTMTGLCQGAH